MKLLSLFSGIGAFEKALSNIGVDYDLVGFSEIDKWAIESYCAIHGVDKSLNLGDVSKINDEDLPKEVDMVTYGFPCQDISVAGNQEGIKKGTRSGLLYEVERIIQLTKPKYAIAENVKNLVGKKFKKDFDELLKRLDGYGYNNYWKVLNAKDYGIPQNRERVFIVSIRKDIDDGGFSFPNNSIPMRLLSSYIDKTSGHSYLPHHTQQHLINTANNSFSVYGIGASRGRFCEKEGRNIQRFEVNKLGICNTITTVQKDNILVDRQGLRYLTSSEALCLMGYTQKDYLNMIKHGVSDGQIYKQAGNSIVVNVLEYIFINLLKEEIENELE